MNWETYFWVFMATLFGFHTGAWSERSDEPKTVETVEQVCVDELFRSSGLKLKGLSSDARRDDI